MKHIYILTVSGTLLSIHINIKATIRLKGILKLVVLFIFFIYLVYIYNMYNKFSKSNVSKLGSEIIRNGGGLTPTMERGVMSAIPIWEMLNITEEQYQLDYEYVKFVKNEEAITKLVKDAFDASLNAVKD
jgi:hypothetical protein